MTNTNLFHDRLKAERKRLKLTQEAVATLCGVARETWGRYESGAMTPGADVLTKAAKAGFNVGYTLAGEGRLNVEITPREMALIDSYRLSHSDVQRGVEALLAATATSKDKT